jgi:REP element-mobilizing transposase RayT
MSRPLRLEYPGAVYHITCRGNERRAIFRDTHDRESFLDILVQSKKIYDIRLVGYVLMDNHFHLLLETPLGNLGQFMRRFNITYTSYFNRTHNRVGHLFQGRYKSILVEKESYLSELSKYIHLNPVRTKEIEKKPLKEKWDYLVNYPWSSLKGYLAGKNKEPFLEYSLVLADYGGDNDPGRRAYQKRIKEDLSGKLEIKGKVVGQAILGGDHFIKWAKETIYPKRHDRECPSLNELKRYRAVEEVLEILSKETGKTIEEVKVKRHPLRPVFMDLLYRAGGLTGIEVGKIFGVDYSTVSQTRKRLALKIEKDQDLRKVVNRIEKKLSI